MLFTILYDMSKCDHRLWIELNGPELHIYNRSELYSRLEELFGLDSQIPSNYNCNESIKELSVSEPSKDMSFWSSWRDLIPVIKVDLNMARFIFGNRLIPSTLHLTMDKAECFYSTKPAACSLDFFMHVIKSKAENFKVILAPSPKYTGILDEPPRFMGEGFVVMSSSKIQFYYYMDEAGIVPAPSQNLLIPNGDDLYAPPVWGIDIKCEKGTNLSYGPWADRQREQLFRIFFPQDYQKMDVAKTQSPGEIRQAYQFDVRLSILTEATIDILFTKEKETNAVHMTCQKGSYFEMTLPWIVNKEGYVIRINGQFLYLDASTSLQYRNLFEAESFKYEVNVKYPLIWNRHQNWDMIFHGSKVTYHFLYIHKEFFRDLIDDWSSKAQPDILNFVPYSWNFSFNFKLFELVTLANEYNWVDCSSQHQANAHIAFCGDYLDLQFSLPAFIYLPEVVPLKFVILGRTLFLSLYLPPTTTTSNIIEALDRDATYHDNGCKKIFSNPSWRKFCKISSGWVNCWQVPELKLILGYTYHPVPPLGPSPQANVSTPEKMEILLSPIRAPKKKKSPNDDLLKPCKSRFSIENFDPSSLDADIFTVELHIIQPSEIKLYGSILRHFIHLKENIFGEDQKFIDMCEPNPYEIIEEQPDIDCSKHSNSEDKDEEFDKRKYRPFEVTVNIDIRTVTGHLMKDCADDEPPCPIINLDSLVFEMNKKFHETQMQVVIAPLVLTTVDNAARSQNHIHLKQGFLLLSGFQMRGHAMFSDEGQNLSEETIEYSWLVELTVGSLSGKLTTPQLQHVITGLETFIFTAVDNENCLRHPRPYHLCYHNEPQPDCTYTLPDHYCPTVDIIKYKMFRTSIDAVDFHLVEAGTDLNLQVYPIRIATCNLHGQHTRSGVTAHIENIRLKNYVCGWSRDFRHSNDLDSKGGNEASSVGGLSGFGITNSGTANSSSTTVGGHSDVWVEAGALILGPIYIDAAVSSNVLYHDMQLIQHKFLKQHDEKTKRLWFLWPLEATNIPSDVFGKCGCVGGCCFFATNKNGKRFFKPSKQDFIEGINVAQFRMNESGMSPGYGQSILVDQQLVFQTYFSCLNQCQIQPTCNTDKEQLQLSSGYAKSTSPALPLGSQPPGSVSTTTFNDSAKHFIKANQQQTKGIDQQTSQDFNLQDGFQGKKGEFFNDAKILHETIGQNRIGESNSLGRQTKDLSVLLVPCGESLTSPGSLADIRIRSEHLNEDQNSLKMPSSLSLQAELPSQSGQLRFSLNGKSECAQESELGIPCPKDIPSDSLGLFRRTISVGSEALSEAFYSADEDQMQAFSLRCASISPSSSQVSLPAVNETLDETCRNSFDDSANIKRSISSSDTQVKPLPRDHIKSKLERYLESEHQHRSNSSASSCSSTFDSSSTGTCDYRTGTLGHSQTSLLHSSESDVSNIEESNIHTKVEPRKKIHVKTTGDDFFSEMGSASSNSFISAVSSQEDIALVDLHMQLNKPITESPLLMSSYINHMTQLRCQNWDSPRPIFAMDKSCCCSNQARRIAPLFEKISEGFTAFRMVEGTNYTVPTKSPPSCSYNTPSHPYSWDTPVFVWGEATDNTCHDDADEIIGSNIFDANTTRTTVVIKLKKDVDLTISPIALESAQRFIDALTPVMESLHPLTIVNRTHIKSVSSVVKKNTLKKDRYMYWSRLRDGKKCGTPEQAPVVTSTYRESCFQQIQGQVTIPRVNFTLLQASVVEEIISFSALDNIKDLTCVSLFSFCLDGVKLQFYSGHQSKQSVQIFMRNPKVSGKPKKSKSKTKLNVDLFTEPVYIETSERQQEENMISLSVHKLHVQLRRLKNESSLLKDASITAIPSHRSKVMFTFKRDDREEQDDEILELNHNPLSVPSSGNHSDPDEERMGFIMFEAGLENVALKAVKRKGFGDPPDGNGKAEKLSRGGSTTQNAACGKEGPSQSRKASTVAANTSSSKGPIRTNSAPASTPREIKASTSNASEQLSSNSGVTPGPATAPVVSTTFNISKGTPETKVGKSEVNETQNSTSPSQGSSAAGQSTGIPASISSKNINKDDAPASVVPDRILARKDITSFVIELSTVWFNFATPPHTPITKKIDYTRLDWNLLSTASPSINAWMNPSDRLTVAVIHFLHSSESRRLGVMACLMAEALDMQSIHVPPKNKYSKLMPLSQTIQEDPSSQLCNVIRRYILHSSLKQIESNLTSKNLPKLATLRQGVVVLSRQWKSALYMPLLMEQTFKYKQSHPVYSYRPRSASQTDTFHSSMPKFENQKGFEEKFSFLQHERESLLSNIDEGMENKEENRHSEDANTDGFMSSSSSHLPPRHSLPSFPPRSSTASVIIPPLKTSQESPRKFFPKFGIMFEETLNFFRTSPQHPMKEKEDNLEMYQGSVPAVLPTLQLSDGLAEAQDHIEAAAGGNDSHSNLSAGHQSLNSDNDAANDSPRLPREDLYKWMARQQEHNLLNSQASRPTVTFNKGLDLPTLSEGSEEDEQEVNDAVTDLHSKLHPPPFFQEPQPAHFLEAHVIFEPLLSAIGIITQQVSGGALEQLGENVTVTASVEILRMDISESEASKLKKKKRKTGKFFLDVNGGVASFICEKMGLEIDISKVADESRSWVCQQPTLFVSRSALKQHTSTMVHFSLNVHYIAQQVNMPLLRLLHQISSMYQNARQTQIGLKEQRPSKTKHVSHHQRRSKESFSELQSDFKAVEYSLSLSEEQGTLSSVGGFKGQRGSLVSSLSIRAASPTNNQQGTLSRLGRPQSFAQKLKSSTKISKGYMNLVLEREKGAHSPLLSLSASVSGLESATVCSDKSPLLPSYDQPPPTPTAVPSTPKCWRNIYYLVDLYATTPETKTVQQRTVVVDLPERCKPHPKYDSVKETKDVDVETGLPASSSVHETSILTDKNKDSVYLGSDRTPLMIFGLAKIQKTKLLATLSGLKLEAEMNAMHSSITFRERIKCGGIPRSLSELSLTGHIGSTMIVLLEGIAPNQQTVVRVTIKKSQGLYSSLSLKSKDKNSAFITIGPVEIDIPQHPIILHDMMTRGTKQLSTTLQELRVTRPSRLSRGTTIDEVDAAPSPRPSQSKTPEPIDVSTISESILHPLAIQFTIMLQEMSIHAALLPSLQATYCMQQVSSIGITGTKAKFNIHLPSHHLAFSTKIQLIPNETNLPPSAKIGLPQVRVEAEYIHDDISRSEINADDGMVLREGSYLNAIAEIGALEHSLTTDLLNHLVFVQKVFMKEVNEVVQKMSGSDKLVPLWTEEGSSSVSAHPQRLLFSIQIKLKGIIITATTPTQSAVRLETGTLELELSNRVENVRKASSFSTHLNQNAKIFGRAQVDITLALGQLIRNELFDEVEPELQQLAYFRTRICLRNAFRDELTSVGVEGEMVMITLTRPLICIQPSAVDKAVLVWLNYKNAYEYWNEQRATLNKEVLTATQQVFEKVPQFSSLSTPNIKSNLFLKLSVCDIGLCLPLNPCRTISHQVDATETKDALVVTLDSTVISACNSGSLVCKAHFKKFCTRFAPDFETSLDDWKPDLRDPSIMNLCMVSEGTYEVCSRTVAQNSDKGDNAKWLLNVQWQMEGVELHLDVNIGKHLTALARTLTTLTGVPDATDGPSTDFDSEGDDNLEHTPQDTTSLPAFIFDPHMGAKQRAKLLEIEMNEQAKTVNDLKTLGASASTIETEIRRLKELEQIVSNDFRRDMLMKIRRQSIKATSMKDRLGLGPKLQLRSKSFRVPSPTVEVKEPVRHCSIASGSTDSNPLTSDEVDVGEVFLTTASEMTLPLNQPQTPSPITDNEADSATNRSDCTVKSSFSEETFRKKASPQSPYGSSYPPGVGPGSTPAAGFKRTDPSIDLELDVKVCINSGECLLYNKDFTKDEEAKGKMKKERSFSGGIHELPCSSPGSIRRKSDMRNISATKLKHSSQATPHANIELTAFFIPGLDVKVHYESHNIHEDTPVSGGKGTTESDILNSRSCSSPINILHYSSPRTPKYGQSKSFTNGNNLSTPSTSESHLSHNFHSNQPSPYIKRPVNGETSEPNAGRPTGLPSFFSNSIGGLNSGGSGRRVGMKRASLFTWLTLQSIPEETIISPSILDFMEKVLEPISLPEPSKAEISSPVSTEPDIIYNLDMDSSLSGGMVGGGYSYASFPVDVIVYFHMQPSTIRFSCQPVSRVECLLKLPSLNVVFSSKRAEESTILEGGKVPSARGGLSVTGALEDFSLFVFHPYGGKHRGGSNLPLGEGERKDSLSVMVEFVNFHISRSRKIHFKQENISMKKPSIMTDNSKAVIRFSTIVDIGAALFKYDMRRLTEILAFPRAWYRRTIVRRLFLGDMTSRSMPQEADDVSPSSTDSSTHSQGGKRHSTSSTDMNNDTPRVGNQNPSSGITPTSPPNIGLKSDNTNCKNDKIRINSNDTESGVQSSTKPVAARRKSGSWETLVQFAVNFKKLNVHMNMGNVMGNAVWTTKDFKSNGRLSIGSTGHKNLYIGLGLEGSCLDAKGGIVGGIIELSEINMYLKIREDPGTDPDHIVGLKLFASQSRLDYMGTSVLMGRVSSFSVSLKDDWKLKQCAKDDEEDTTRRGATIFILGDLEWDQLQLLISKSTTADLLKMHHKLEEFFTAQFKSSKRVFSSLQPMRNKSSLKSKEKHRDVNRKLVNGNNSGSDARHHRHWQGVLYKVSGLCLTTLPHPLPKTGTVLGGSLELHGKTIFLACFHGINFKSKSWALFSLKQPYINFTSEIQEVSGEVTTDTHIVQNFTFSLGLMEQTHAQHVSMAKVCRITRNMVFPPKFTTLQEWFFYAFCTSDLDDVDRFPSLDGSRTDSLNSNSSSNESRRASSKLPDHNHSSETIFALPSMEVHLNTKHRQTPEVPDITDNKPVVECSFVTEFQDHIFVTIDAENFFFLHDLINSYVKDTKEKMGPETEPKGEKKSKLMVNEPTQILQQDWREFSCPTWHLEPTVRLLSWATRNLEPYGIDYILNKLGFSHARTTIPKWLQRGCMDPLDKVLSILLCRMIIAIHEHDSSNR